MARTQLTVQSLSPKAGVQPTFYTILAGDVTNGLQYPGTGLEIIVLKSAATSGATLAFMAAPCAHGRSGGGTAPGAAGVAGAGDVIIVVGASDFWIVESFPTDQFNQPASSPANQVFVNVSSQSGTVQIAVVHQ